MTKVSPGRGLHPLGRHTFTVVYCWCRESPRHPLGVVTFATCNPIVTLPQPLSIYVVIPSR